MGKCYVMFLSVSGRRLLKKCPHKWELKYITKAKGRRENTRNFVDGSVVHEIIKDWFDEDMPPVVVFFNADRVREGHDKFLAENHVRWRRGETAASHLENTVEKAKQTALSFVDIPFRSFGTFRVESYIKVDLDNNHYWRLGGKIDLWLEVLREVYDFKITKYKQYFDLEQVEFYCFLLSLYTNKMHAKGGIIAPLLKRPTGGDLDRSFTIEDFRAFRKKLIGEFNSIFEWLAERKNGKHFPANKDDKNCWDCPFKNAGCAAWSLGAQHYGVWAGKGTGSFFDSKD